MNFRERMLSNTFVYKTFKELVSPKKKEELTVRQFLNVPQGSRVLDLGCGYGDMASYFVDHCHYVGIDSNPRYISEARRRNADNEAVFIVGDIGDSLPLDSEPYELVLLSGVLHHLSSDYVVSMAEFASRLLAPSGRFVAIEPVFHPDQRLSARLIIASDRGRFVRDVEGYLSLLSRSFNNVEVDVVHGRLRIPYSHAIITCTR